MTDRRIPLSVPDLRGNEAAYLAKCVTDNWVSTAGPFVTELEDRMAALCGRRAAVACVNGSAALHVALLALGVAPGDVVIVPDWTFAATANAIVHAGAQPCFVDIQRSDWTVSPQSIETAFAKYGKRIRAMVAVDVVGNLPDPGPLNEIAARYDVPVLEDAAGAIGAARDGMPAGSLGKAAVFSFNGNKLVTAGGGGVVVTDDEELAARFRHVTTQARTGQDYRHDAVGFNYRMTNLNAAVGVAQLEVLDALLADKRRIARDYQRAVAGRSDMAFMPVSRPEESSYWLVNVVVADEPSMRSLVSHLSQAGIDARPFWCSLSEQGPYRAFPSVAVDVSRSLTDCVVTLPCSSNLKAEDQARVLNALDEWQGHRLPESAE